MKQTNASMKREEDEKPPKSRVLTIPSVDRVLLREGWVQAFFSTPDFYDHAFADRLLPNLILSRQQYNELTTFDTRSDQCSDGQAMFTVEAINLHAENCHSRVN